MKNNIEKEELDQKIFNIILFFFFLIFITIFVIFYNNNFYKTNKKFTKYTNNFNYNGLVQNMTVQCGKNILLTLKDGSYYCNIYPIKFKIGNLEIAEIKSAFNPYILIAGKRIINYSESKNLLTDNKKIMNFIENLDIDKNKTNGIFIPNDYKRIVNKYVKTTQKIEKVDEKILNNILKEIDDV